MKFVEDCELCKAIQDSINNKEMASVFNINLQESESFVVMPCIGPLFAGHVLIVSKGHYESLGSMPLKKIIEFESVLKSVLNRGNLYKNALVSEHGSYDKQKGGSCIEHTHVHVIPKIGKLYRVLDSVLPKTNIITFKDIGELTEPYIFNYNNIDNKFVCYTAYNVESQMMRLAICNNLNRTDSHWALNDRKDLVIKTIDYWTNQ